MMAIPLSAKAGATVKIGDESQIDIGLRLQTQLVGTEKDRRGDGQYEREVDFNIRRARLRVRADINKWIGAFVQTDFEEQAGTSADMRIIDAYVLLKASKLAWLYVGEYMVPALRQNLSSSSSHMAIDRPGLAYKPESWGGRSKYQFTNETYGDSNAKMPGRVNVRDLGATLFGSTSLTDTFHFKYYLGVYDGVQTAGSDWARTAARVQLNFLDPEPKYYNDSTYLGKKKTIGIGASVDWQKNVALAQTSGKPVDYRLISADAFTDMPVGPGSITGEVGFVNLNLGGVGQLVKLDQTKLGNASRSQGNGVYAQAGFFVTDANIQPWANYEQWKSSADDKRGSYKAYRAGLNYYLRENDAKLILGLERFEPDDGFTAKQKRINSVLLGAYIDL
jgi:hypothetical protein